MLITGDAIGLLNQTRGLDALAIDHVEVIVVESSPTYLDLAFELFPVTGKNIPIHLALSQRSIAPKQSPVAIPLRRGRDRIQPFQWQTQDD